MSADTDPGKGFDANDPRDARWDIALSRGLWCLENPDVVVELATWEMLGTGNQILLEITERLARHYTVTQGEVAGEWFKRGASVAFLYFNGIAEEVYSTPLQVVSMEDIAKERKEGRQLYREELLEAELNIDKELTLKRLERVKGKVEQMDEPLHKTIFGLLSDPKNKALSLEAFGAFLNGAFMVNRLLRSSQKTKDDK